MGSLNGFPPKPAGRRPRGIVKIDGKAVPGWIEFTVTNNSYAEADTFEVTYAASALPKSNGADWFMGQAADLFVEIFAGLPSDPDSPNASELTSLIYGRVDDIEFDPVRTVVKLTGRDLTGAFIDAKLITQYVNQGVISIIQSLADSHQIEAFISPAPPQDLKVGTYYERDTVQLGTNNSEWDLICQLARENGLVTYVSGKTLNFVPDPRPSATPYLIQWKKPDSAGGPPQANVIDLEFSRSMTVAKGISVTVRSASFKDKPIVRSYPKNPRGIQPGKSSPYGALQPYYYNLPPGSTVQQVEAYAEGTFQQITSHAMKLRATLPADGVLSINMPIRVQGTGTPCDQIYFPRQIRRTLSMEEGGYMMEVEAQNTTPELAQAANSP